MLQDLFTFHREGVDANGTVVGRFVSTGIRPHFADQLKFSGHVIDGKAFAYLTA
jgi:pilus assembly protein CpaF